MIKFDLKKCINDVLKDIDRIGQNVYFSANLSDLNEILGIIKGGNVITIAGRPVKVKTSFSFPVIENFLSSGKKVLVHSMEISARNYIKTFLCATANIDCKKLLNKNLSDEERKRLFLVAQKISNSSLIIDDSIIVNIEKIKKNIEQESPDILVIDSIQSIQKKSEEQETIDTIMQNLKRIAVENSIIIVLLSQLYGERNTNPDILKDLKDIAIAKISDMVVIVDYENYYKIENTCFSKILTTQ